MYHLYIYSYTQTRNCTDKFIFDKMMLFYIFLSRSDNGDNHLYGHEVILCIGHGASVGILMDRN